MSSDVAIINASPFILLSKSGIIDLLPKLFTEVVMPEAVYSEIAFGKDLASQIAQESSGAWLKRVHSATHADVEIWNLGDGETELLSHAVADPKRYIALIDDRPARRCSSVLGIRTLGTAGIIVLAKQRGLIDTVRSPIETLIGNGLYITDEILRAVYAQANEA